MGIVFTVRRHASAIAYMPYKRACLSVTNRCSILKQLNVRSRKQRHTIVSDVEDIGKNTNRVTPNGGAKCRWGRLKLATFDKQLAISKTSTVASVVKLVHSQVYLTQRPTLLWSPYGIGQTIIFLPYGFFFFLLSFFFSLPNLSRRRLDACHTSTHGVALVRI